LPTGEGGADARLASSMNDPPGAAAAGPFAPPPRIGYELKSLKLMAPPPARFADKGALVAGLERCMPAGEDAMALPMMSPKPPPPGLPVGIGHAS
jgi:hypothetical protein